MRRLIQGMFALGVLAAPAVASADPGQLVGIEIDSVDVDADMEGDNVYGYWEYLPTAYDEEGDAWPMFIFLSGTGENGNGLLPPGGCTGPGHGGSWLCRNLRHGPQSHLWNNLYGNGSLTDWVDADGNERPFIVISPQNPLPNGSKQNPSGPYDPDDVNDFLDFLIEHYNVDPRRIYLTGMSMGGYSVTLNAVDYSGRFAAIAPLPGIRPNPMSNPCDIGRSAMWAFHGEDDQAGGGAFDAAQMTAWVASVDECPEPHPDVRLTMFANAGHNVWSRTIDPTQGQDDAVVIPFPYAGGSQTFDTIAYEPDLYTWLLLHDLPEVDAGADFTVTTDDPSFDITASIIDDDAVAFTWTQTDGDALTLSNDDTQTLTVSDLVEGTYTFRVFALDADDQYDEDTVTVTIEPGLGGSSSSSGGETSSTGGDSSSSGDASTGGSSGDSSGSSSSTTSGSGGGDDTTGGTDSAGSASGSASGSEGSASGTATASGSGSGSSSGGDTDGSGSDGGGGGCSTGSDGPPGVWMLGLFGLVAARRRRD